MERSWLTGPLLWLAAGQAASSVGSLLLAIAYPHDAALIFVPQAIGTSVVATGVLAVARNAPPTPSPSSGHAGWLRGPLRLLALGYTAYAFGWFFYAVAERDQRSVVVAAASIAAFGTFLTTAAAWQLVRRIPRPEGA